MVPAAERGSALKAMDISVPLSRTPSTASSSAFSSISSAQRKRIFLRPAGAILAHTPASKLVRAAATAAATSCSPAFGICVSVCPSTGELTSRVWPLCAATDWPPMIIVGVATGVSRKAFTSFCSIGLPKAVQ